MANWSTTTKHEPSSINNGRRYELRDRVSIEQLNNMTENSFYAMEKASEANEKSERALSHALSGGSKIYENGVFVPEFDADRKIPKYGNDIKLAPDNDGGLTDAIITTNARIDNLSFADIDELWSGSIVGGNPLDIDVSGYKYLICDVKTFDSEVSSIIIDTSVTSVQMSTPFSSWNTDNHLVLVQYEFRISADKKSISFSNNILYQIGNPINNHSTNKLIRVMGVK